MHDLSDSATVDSTLLECRGIGKAFGANVALQSVDLSVRAGEVHGLIGSNGAGKSTLMKILAGAHASYDGEIRIDGHTAAIHSPTDSMQFGIAMVYQELSGVNQLSVAENLFLGRQPVKNGIRVDWKLMRQEARRQLGELQIDVDVTTRLDQHPLVIRQMVEIARGINSGARLLILDEPTSALSPPEVRRLFTLIRQLRERGVAIIFISHFIEDVLEICDRVTVLRNGRKLQTTPAIEVDKHALIHRMLGHSLEGEEIGYETGVTLPPKTDAPVTLEIEGFSAAREFKDVSLAAHEGECLGLYGFVGAGHQELIHAMAGARAIDAGSIRLNGRSLKPGNVHQAVRNGLVMVAADRAQTLVHQAELYKNITLAFLRRTIGNFVFRRREIDVAHPKLQEVGCHPPVPELLARNLSGGNQQKVVLAKWLSGPMKALLLEEPTRGMDVGAKDDIMAIVRDLKNKGASVILASTEPELLLAHADRILVFNKGQVVRELVDEPVDKATIMKYA